MPAAIFNGVNVKILKDNLKGKSGWRIVGSGTYDYSLPTLSGTDTLVSQSTPVFTAAMTLSHQSTPGTAAPSNKDYLYFKNGTGNGHYDGLFFKDDGGVEHEIDPSLGTSSVIRTNAQTINEDITISSTTNGMSAGPITIASTKTVTVNGNWSVV
tara:strand:+ start:23 stop:487 length:465 start_codon:yes stop_codon:yes gene_type:complete